TSTTGAAAASSASSAARFVVSRRSPARSCATASTATPFVSPLASPSRAGVAQRVPPPAARSRLAGAVDPVTVSTVISAPREQVFDYLQDIANHSEFTDHFMVDWHLTRIDSIGRGAGARFRVKAPGN